MLGVGEALVSYLQSDGTPSVVEKILIRPPQSQIGALEHGMRKELIERSPLYARYAQDLDRESAFELLKQRADEKQLQQQQLELQVEQEKQRQAAEKVEAKRSRGRPRQSLVEAMLKSTVRSVGSSLGRRIVRGILGSLLGK